jgi:CRP/FNR family transcriptional regulator
MAMRLHPLAVAMTPLRESPSHARSRTESRCYNFLQFLPQSPNGRSRTLVSYDELIVLEPGETTMQSQALSSTYSPVRPVAQARRPGALAPRTLQEHFSLAPIRAIAAKEHAFTEGDPRLHLYRVEAGAICLYKVMPDGRRQVLGFAYPGDLIGLGACDLHHCNAQATKPSQLRSIPWSAVQRVARHDPALGLRLYEAISLELAAAHDLLLTTGQRSAVERVATFLLAMARRSQRNGQDATVIDLPMTRADIGDFLGLTIETVSRTFTKLRQLKIIDLAQSARVRILDCGALRGLAEGDVDL